MDNGLCFQGYSNLFFVMEINANSQVLLRKPGGLDE